MPKNKKTSRVDDRLQYHNIDEIIKLEERDRTAMSLADKIANVITAFSGSMIYVLIHVVIFSVWILWNTGLLKLRPFDPFPFNLLTMAVSLEAIFLSAFVLISQNKQALQADKRAKIDLQINMLAEQENTRLIEMVEEIQKHLGIRVKTDVEIKALKEATSVNKLAESIDKAEKKKLGKKSKGPQSSADVSR